MLDRSNMNAIVGLRAARRPRPEGFDPREALNFVWRQWKLIAGVTALAIIPRRDLSRAPDAALHGERANAARAATRPSRPARTPLQATKPARSAGDRKPDRHHQIDVAAASRRPQGKAGQRSRIRLRSGRVRNGHAGGRSRAFSPRARAGSRAPKPSPTSRTRGATRCAPELVAAVENLKNAVGVDARRPGAGAECRRSPRPIPPRRRVSPMPSPTPMWSTSSTRVSMRPNALRPGSATVRSNCASNCAIPKKPWPSSAPTIISSRLDRGATLNQEQLGQMNGRLVAARAETAEKKARLELLAARRRPVAAATFPLCPTS